MENKLKIVYVPIEDLKPSEYNPRQMTEGEANRLKDSLDEFGMVEPIVVNGAKERMNIIIGGHQRYNLCKMKGLKEMPVVYVNIPDIEKEQELNLRLNKNMGEWDWDMLANMDVDLLEEVGFDPKELDMHFGIDIEEDEIPEVPEKPISKLGEVYQLGGHRLMCGDSTKIEDVEKLMNGQKADMVFTDPPYGVSYDGGVQTKRDKLIGDENVDLYKPCCKMAMVFSTDDSSLYVWHAGVKGIAAAAAAAAAGWEIRCEIVWNKNLAQFGALSSQYKQKHEPCYYCYKKGKTVNWNGPTNEVTVWDIARASVNDLHPTQKPVSLASRAIKNHSCSLVLDLFGGSGSTLIACEQLDRTCYISEIDNKYVDVIIKRWMKFTGQRAYRIIDAEGKQVKEIVQFADESFMESKK